MLGMRPLMLVRRRLVLPGLAIACIRIKDDKRIYQLLRALKPIKFLLKMRPKKQLISPNGTFLRDLGEKICS